MLAGAAVLAAVAGCGKSKSSGEPKSSAPPPGASAASTVTVTEREFGITADPPVVATGRVRVNVRNHGTLEHELVAFRTDLGETALPLGSDGNVDENGRGVTHVEPEAEEVPPGGGKTMSLPLQPGRYVLVCNLPGHYKAGMHTVLTVR